MNALEIAADDYRLRTEELEAARQRMDAARRAKYRAGKTLSEVACPHRLGDVVTLANGRSVVLTNWQLAGVKRSIAWVAFCRYVSEDGTVHTGRDGYTLIGSAGEPGDNEQTGDETPQGGE